VSGNSGHDVRSVPAIDPTVRDLDLKHILDSNLLEIGKKIRRFVFFSLTTTHGAQGRYGNEIALQGHHEVGGLFKMIDNGFKHGLTSIMYD
jgi:hypothetical protein